MARIGQLPPRQEILVEGTWMVAHALGSALPGWLVLLPLRHVETLHELTPEEAAAIGGLLRRLSAGLVAVTGCSKTYAILMAEVPRFSHLHFHVVPRAAGLSREHLGSGIFEFMRRPQSEWVSDPEQDRLALLLRHSITEA